MIVNRDGGVVGGLNWSLFLLFFFFKRHHILNLRISSILKFFSLRLHTTQDAELLLLALLDLTLEFILAGKKLLMVALELIESTEKLVVVKLKLLMLQSLVFEKFVMIVLHLVEQLF